MGTDISFMFVHTITVAPFEGVGPRGKVYGAPVPVACLFEEKVRLVRAPSGDQVTSSSTAYAALDTVCPAESKVTTPSGRLTTVILAARRDGGGVLPTPDHLEIQLL